MDPPEVGGPGKHSMVAAQTALELVKQLITLASGVLVLSATFIQQFAIDHLWQILLLVVSWLLLVAAVLAGLETIDTIVFSQLNDDNDWAFGRGRRMASASKMCFVAGIFTFAAFAFLTLILVRDVA